MSYNLRAFRGRRELLQNQQNLLKSEILKMPDGYYSGDKPNPNLKAFVEKHIKEHPYDPETDDYAVEPLLKSSKVKRSTKVFNMHTYWSKKPHESVDAFVSHYTKSGDLVLDPFCGSGGIVLVSVLRGKKAIGIDLSPSATFLSSTLCSSPPLEEFQHTFKGVDTLGRRRQYRRILI